MKVLLPLTLLLTGAAPADRPQTFLVSLVRLPLRQNESLEAFSIKTWGVEVASVCRVPPGWRIKAGTSATPDGEISGEGSHGATWFNARDPKELRRFVLITMYGPIQRETVGSVDNGIPATFTGSATINTDDPDVERPLTFKNVVLTPARRCPS